MAEAPQEVVVNGVARRVRAATIPDLLRELARDPDVRGIAVAVNGEVVPRSAWPARRIGAGDQIEIVGAVQGGSTAGFAPRRAGPQKRRRSGR